MSFICLHVNQTDRKLIILVSFLVKTHHLLSFVGKTPAPLQPPSLSMLGEHSLLVLAGSTVTRWSSSAQTQGSQFSQGTMCATWTDILAGSN